jgi:hypothetical protein
MIATSQKYTSPATISRQFEFSRLHHQRIARAYEVLIPIVSGCPQRAEPRLSNGGTTQRGIGATRPSAVGA